MRLPRELNLRVCEQAFDKYCADELVDLRLRDVLEEAFIAGFIAGTAQPVVSSTATAAVGGDSPRPVSEASREGRLLLGCEGG